MNDRYLSLQTAQEKFDVSRQTLLNWEEQGLIHPGKTPGGQRRYSETELLDLFGLNDTSTQPNKRLRDVARRAADLLMNQYGEMIDEIILYGSVARGEADESSDLDFVIVLSEDAESSTSWLRKFHQILMDIKLENDVLISLQVFTTDEWQDQRGTPFYRDVTKHDGIRLTNRAA